jgi:4-hydroxy-tetrahydrodipicolinate synthase
VAQFTPAELKTAIRGPVFPILTPFTPSDFEVDHQALSSYVNFLVEAGAPAILVTVGTSRFNLLTTEEMMAVNQTVIKAVAGRTVAIAAAPIHASLKQNLEFAHHAKNVGADAIMVMYPERHYGDELVYEFYQAIAEQAGIGVMIHEMPIRSGITGASVQYSLDLLDRLTDLPGLAGLKEECGNGEYAYRLLRQIADKTAVIGAGSMRRFMRDFHAGAKAYLVGIGSFLPQLALQFYSAAMSGNWETAHQIARQNEDPYFDQAVALGWHPTLKETLHFLDLMPPYERPPLARLNSEARQQLRQTMVSCGWLKD